MDLEVWLIGTEHEVTQALTALGDVGTLTGASRPEPLYGADSGRIRRYARVRIPVTTTTTARTKATGSRAPHQAPGATPTVPTLLDAA